MRKDVHELALEAIDYGVDKFHDRVYDTAVWLPGAVRRFPSQVRERRARKIVKRAPKEDRVIMSRYDDRDPGYESDGGYRRRSSAGVAQDNYAPQQYGMRDYAARDGYANDSYSAAYTEGRREQQYLDYPRQSYSVGAGYGAGDPRSRSHNDLRDTQYDDRYYDDDRRSRRAGSRGRNRSRSRSKSRTRSERNFMTQEDEDGNTELKKWGATLAGAAVGAFAGRTAKKDHWVPTAIGAVVGGLVAREAEKEFVKRKHDKHLRREGEYEED